MISLDFSSTRRGASTRLLLSTQAEKRMATTSPAVAAGANSMVADPGFGIGGGCDAGYLVDTNWHVFTTVWTSTSIKQYMEGVLETTRNQRINSPTFLIIQTQTGGVGGNPNNGLLPAQLLIDYVKVTQP